MNYHSPIGIFWITVQEGHINSILFDHEKEFVEKEVPLLAYDQKILNQCFGELDEYFQGKRTQFDFPVKQHGTPFQEKVWRQLMHIPYGKTISYLQLSKEIGNVKSVRAAGSANGQNHLPIVVPCHRVIGSNGSLIGYGGGLWRKQWLLEHENKFAHGVTLLF